jgi:F-box and WD-40 domain protein CDC4
MHEAARKRTRNKGRIQRALSTVGVTCLALAFSRPRHGTEISTRAMSTIYVPIVSPPTPAPSPHPSVIFNSHQSFPPDLSNYDPASLSRREFASLSTLPPSVRRRYLLSILNDCTPSELLFVSTTIAPLLKRDFLRELPPEIALHVASFITDPKCLARASQVSKQWRALLSDEWMWKRMCESFQFDLDLKSRQVDHDSGEDDDEPLEEMEQFAILPMDPALQWLAARKRQARKEQKSFPLTITRESVASQFGGPFSYRQHFKLSYETSRYLSFT